MTLEEFRKLKINDHLIYEREDAIALFKITSIEKIINTYNHICYIDIIYSTYVINYINKTNKGFALGWDRYDITNHASIANKKQIDYYYKLAVFK